MLRSYRCFLVALVGWLSVAASPPQQPARQQQSASSEKVAAALENMAAALKGKDEPSRLEQPCEEGGDDRNSDLCAQWKAADAAQSAANAAWWLGGLGAATGLLTLAAAAAAAYFARDAAIHTAAGAKQAKRAADAAEEDLSRAADLTTTQLRPYLAANKETVEVLKDGTLLLAVYLKNVGQTPALELSSKRTARFIITGPRKRKVSSMITFDNGRMGTVGPQVPIENYSIIGLSPAKVLGLKCDRAILELDIALTFSNEFGETWEYTQNLYVSQASFTSGVLFTRNCEARRLEVEGDTQADLPFEEKPEID